MESKTVTALRQIALAYPETEEGVTCDKSSFKARGKAFLFIGHDDASYTVMLKLGESLPEAAKLAAAHPANYKVGGHNWVNITFPHTRSASGDLFQRWIDESFRLLAPKQLVAGPRQSAKPARKTAKVKAVAKKPAPRKTARRAKS